MNLLIVNDEALTAITMKENIAWKEYGIDQVFVAFSAGDARQVIAEEQIDIMLTDIDMPGEDGVSLLRDIRAKGNGMACIFLTCHALFSYAHEAIGLDCHDYILMPAKPEQIGNAVLKAVRSIEQKRKNERMQEYGKMMLQKAMGGAEAEIGKRTPEQMVEAVKCYVVEKLQDEGLFVNEIAEAFHLHPVYLNRIFKKKTGMPLSQYILEERMHRAADLLAEGTWSANDVAIKVGYKNYSNFYNAFRRYYNSSPSVYEKKVNNKSSK